MINEVNLITQQLFDKPHFNDLSIEEIGDFIGRYPYVAPARFLLARKKNEGGEMALSDEVITAGLYFNNPLWFYHQLNNDEAAEQAAEPQSTHPEQTAPAVVATTDAKVDETEPIVFQSYHTIDYFASQGIRLQQADLAKDRLGQQLKSFTEWLRSMKKLPSAENEIPSGDVGSQQAVILNAASSIEEKEVVTEAMAEVWAKQGNTQKAIDTYAKLSLQNPSKSAYFAAKIDQLK